MLIGFLKVSIKIIRATKDIIKTIIIFKTPIFFIFLFSIISFFLGYFLRENSVGGGPEFYEFLEQQEIQITALMRAVGYLRPKR